MNYQRGFSPNQKADAAKLYCDAFERKFIRIIGSKQKILELFELGLNPDFCFVAYDNENQLVGLLGFRIGKNQLLTLNRKEFQQMFGLFNGIFKSFLTKLIFSRKVTSDKQIMMDGVAVSAQVRGQGVGSKLFSEFIEYAKLNGFSSVRLDVIDENSRAKSLYEKLGFRSTKHLKTPWPINRLIGVSGSTTMILQLH